MGLPKLTSFLVFSLVIEIQSVKIVKMFKTF